MTTDLPMVPHLPGPLELAERDREAAEAVASGLRDAKAASTRRAYASAWRQFQAWAEAVRGWRNRAPDPKQADALTSDALARFREVLRFPRRGRE